MGVELSQESPRVAVQRGSGKKPKKELENPAPRIKHHRLERVDLWECLGCRSLVARGRLTALKAIFFRKKERNVVLTFPLRPLAIMAMQSIKLVVVGDGKDPFFCFFSPFAFLRALV